MLDDMSRFLIKVVDLGVLGVFGVLGDFSVSMMLLLKFLRSSSTVKILKFIFGREILDMMIALLTALLKLALWSFSCFWNGGHTLLKSKNW